MAAVVKSLRSIDNLPFKHAHILAFPYSPKSCCINKYNRRKKISISKTSLLPNREPITNGI